LNIGDGRATRRADAIKEAKMAVRTANAWWEGALQQGHGTMAFGGFEGQFSYASRFEEGTGTNPEELLGAAHAGCFSMSLANLLATAGHEAKRVETTARVHLEPQEEGPKITRIELQTEVDAPGIDDEAFQGHAKTAEETCPVSKALAGVEISLDAKLVSN
jgi:osmotically inducible protein OsmC